MAEQARRLVVTLGCVLGLAIWGSGIAEGCLRVNGVYAGEMHSMLTMENDSVWSCGDNAYGQLGLGNTIDQSSLTQVLSGTPGTAYIENIVSVAPGTRHTVALDANGNVWSWGANCYDPGSQYCEGILGNDREDPCYIPVQVLAGEQADDPCDLFLEDIVTIGAGRSGRHSLAVDVYGNVWSWGSNKDFGGTRRGQLGHGTTIYFSRTPVRVYAGQQSEIYDPCTPDPYASLTNIIAVAGGMNHSLALEDPGFGGKVYSFGANNHGQLGDGGTTSSGFARVVLTNPNDPCSYLEDIIDVRAGAEHSMALDEDGHVHIWGTVEWDHSGGTDEGTLGNGSSAGIGSAVAVYVQSGEQNPGDPNLPLSNIIAISAGAAHSMALDSGGHVWTWGNNHNGQLGVGEDGDYCAIRPVKVHGGGMGTEFLEHITAIAAGYGYCLALDEDGIVWSWGFNYDGQLGLGDTMSYNVPMQVPFVETFWVAKLNADPNNDCVCPFDETQNNYLTYDISYDPNADIIDDGILIDYLPLEVDYESSDPCGVYDAGAHTVTWQIDELATTEVELVTKVNYYAKPGGVFTNEIHIERGAYVCAMDTLDTDVCYEGYGTEIIYVNDDANGYDNGTNWDDAYADLQYALDTAEDCNASVTAIWVAAGTYLPVTPATFDSDASFELLSDVALLGHFVGTETSPSQRQLDNPAYTSWLKGQIDATHYVKSTVTAADISNAVLDGFKITTRTAYSYNHGIDMDNASVLVRNCTITENYSGIYADQAANVLLANSLLTGNYNDIYLTDACAVLAGNALMESYYGVYANNSDVRMNRCAVGYQYYNGIRCDNGSLLTLHNSEVYENEYPNIALDSGSDTEIINNWIYKSGSSGIAFADQVSSDFIVRNNTICDNASRGISGSGSLYPAVSNCIIVGNNSGDLYPPASFTSVNYCVLQNSHSGQGNMVADPCFIDASYTFYPPGYDPNDPNAPEQEIVDPNDYHIAWNSPCKDTADPCGFYLSVDFDDDARIWFGHADIGADEFTDADLNDSNRVDLADFNMLAGVYDTASSLADFNDDNVVDLDDMTMMCQVWLTTQPIGGLTLTMEPDFMVGGQMASMMMPLSVPLGLETLSPEETTAVYYAMDPAETLSARQDQLAADIAMLEDMLYWMDTIALIDPDLPAADQKAWDEFYKALEQQLKRLNHLAQRL